MQSRREVFVVKGVSQSFGIGFGFYTRETETGTGHLFTEIDSKNKLLTASPPANTMTDY